MKREKVFVIFLLFISTLSIVEARTVLLPQNYENGKMVLIQNMLKERNTTYIIKWQYDLQGSIIKLPEGAVLKFKDEGRLTNGTLTGNNSSLCSTSNRVRFCNITIEGTWRVPVINSELFMFGDDAEQNTKNFRSMCMLTSDDNEGRIHIADGEYLINLDTNNESCFHLNSRTELVIDGDIILESNDLEFYQIVNIKNKEKVKVHGTGSLIGDVNTHFGTAGEWGMGVAILDSDDIEVRDLTIKNCWGDCIYIGQVGYEKGSYSKNVLIDNVICQSGRRQGMSIISGKDIYVTNSKFIDTGSIKFTAPGAGIDIEPNILGNTIVDNIVIDHCEFYGNINNRDFLTYNLDTTANVVLRNSKLDGDVYFGKGSYNVTIDSCELNSVLTPQINYGSIKISNSTIRKRKEVDESVSFENCTFEENDFFGFLLWIVPCGIVFTLGAYGTMKHNMS